MNTTIYIPTRGRLKAQITWESISPKWRERTRLVADYREAEILREWGYPALSCTEKGIGDTRQWILDGHKEGNVMMMDDDLGFAVRREDDPTKFRRMESHDEFDDMMERIEEMMNFVPLAGISNRSGANRETAPYRRNVRMHDCLIVNTQVAREQGFKINRIQFMEDFDFILQHLTKGFPTLCLNSYVKDDMGGSNAAGGCSEYRDAVGQFDAAMELHLEFPEFVKMVERPGWNGMGTTRPDVRVQWAKSFAAGVRWRETEGLEQELEFDWDETGRLMPL